MQTPVVVKSRSVLGATELTLMAPLKSGLIPALDSRSYATRASAVLATLHALGVSRREIDPTPAITEVADAIRAIRSFRLSIVGGEPRQVLLSVSFDGGWEPYMRRIWHPLGPLLDVIFCNCEGYLLSTSHSYPAYAAWVRRSQVQTDFYYEDSPLTVWDLHESRKRFGAQRASPAAGPSLHEQARAAMVALYRLTDLYPPLDGNEDGETLLRAAQLLLCDVHHFCGPLPPQFLQRLLRTPAEQAAWRWFSTPLRPRFKAGPGAAVDRDNVQAGILESYLPLAHGCLVLVGLDDAAAAVALIDHVKPQIASAARSDLGPRFTNLAFTYAGLQVAGVDAGTLEQLPQEFREGMEARAGVLGDWQHNHPSHWTLPERHGGGGPPRVELSSVHALVQFWLPGVPPPDWVGMEGAEKQLLQKAVDGLDAALRAAGGRVLSVQPMQRMAGPGGDGTVGHFGFADGISQPGLRAHGRIERDTVEPGDLLLGYNNGRGDPGLDGRVWKDSTFLVVRKLRQDVAALDQLTQAQRSALMGRNANGVSPFSPGDDAHDNDFDYAEDPAGRRCPHFAHVRRANPRSTRPDLAHLPRIVRRGMSYGPRLGPHNADADRGLVFMAYNASIAEQFEVVQGWLAGANSTGPGSYSGLRDPFVGVAREGEPRSYVWKDESGERHSVELPADRPLVTLQWGLYAFVPSLRALDELRNWAAEAALEDAIDDVDQPRPGYDPAALQRKIDRRDRQETLLAARGAALIARLQQGEQALGSDAAVSKWKEALEDSGARMTGISQAVWAAIRKVHGGVLRTPYGVLVCSKAMVEEVFLNAQGRYTATGYNVRLAKSFGEIYLGRDDDDAYRAEAGPANAAIMAVTAAQAFDSAFWHTERLLKKCKAPLQAGEDIVVEMKDLVDATLANFSREWFGLPDGTHVEPGGWHWGADDPPTCPGHFHAPSRYTFQPQPGDAARRSGEQHGKSLKARVRAFARAARGRQGVQGRLGRQLFAAFADDDRLASTLIGVMMGFLPTVDGNLRSVLFEWIRDRSLWDHQAALCAPRGPHDLRSDLRLASDVLGAPLARTMQLRPVPELVWRTARLAHELGSGANQVKVRPGDTVVVSIVSATQEDLLARRTDPYVVFGGNRKPQPPGAAHPTHACPGHDMAIGVMLGFLAALLGTTALRPAASPAALRISA